MRRRWQRGLLAGASTLAALAVIEIALRGGALYPERFIRPDPVLGWSLKPGYRAWSRDENLVWVEHNSAGWRDRERAIAKPAGTIRVAVVGDSFIHGYFLALDETYGHFLEQELTRCAGGRPVEVLSFGVFDYNTTQELLTYREHASRYAPDVVLLAFFSLNDVSDNHPRLSSEFAPRYVYDGDRLVLDSSFQARLPAPPRVPWRRHAYEWLIDHAHTARLVKEVAEQAQRGVGATAKYDPAPDVTITEHAIYKPPSTPDQREAWRITEGVLLKFAEEVRAHGSEPWLATLYTPAQVDPDVNKRRALADSLGVESLFYPDRRLAGFARDQGLPVISLAEPLADYAATQHVLINGGNSPGIRPGEGHWNKIGTSVAAAISAREICRASRAFGSAQALHASPANAR